MLESDGQAGMVLGTPNQCQMGGWVGGWRGAKAAHLLGLTQCPQLGHSPWDRVVSVHRLRGRSVRAGSRASPFPMRALDGGCEVK